MKKFFVQFQCQQCRCLSNAADYHSCAGVIARRLLFTYIRATDELWCTRVVARGWVAQRGRRSAYLHWALTILYTSSRSIDRLWYKFIGSASCNATCTYSSATKFFLLYFDIYLYFCFGKKLIHGNKWRKLSAASTGICAVFTTPVMMFVDMLLLLLSSRVGRGAAWAQGYQGCAWLRFMGGPAVLCVDCCACAAAIMKLLPILKWWQWIGHAAETNATHSQTKNVAIINLFLTFAWNTKNE